MKFKWVTFVFLALVAAAIRLPAQQSDADRKFFDETKVKAETGNADAQYTLGYCYFLGRGVANDDVEAAKWFRKAAVQGFAQAQCVLGLNYRYGQGGIAKDYVEEAKWYKKAAEQNFALAENELARCYFFGEGVTMDKVEAVKWYRKAAEQNNTSAQYSLGRIYRTGNGVKKNLVEAVKWYRKAADQNDASAQHDLGMAYYLGEGVEKDMTEAVKWCRRAADQNDAYAQCLLGACYGDGDGVEKNAAESVKWYRRAAEQNQATAQYNLANCYARGIGVPIDYVEAYKWFNLATAQGERNAKKGCDIMAAMMTPDQIAEAQRRSFAFVPHKETPSSGSTHSNLSKTLTATATGFFITEDGYLISNYHVVKGAAKVRLLTGAGLIDAAVVKVDAANDLALLKAVGRFAPLPIAASRTVKLGGTVATVGFPDIGLQGFAPKLAKGEIASLAGAADDPRYFQISLPVQPGNSGGALVDARGNVVGIVAAKLSAKAALDATGQLPENVNYAVKSSLLLSFLESVPDVAAKLKDPKSLQTATPPFEDVVKSAQDAAVLVLVY